MDKPTSPNEWRAVLREQGRSLRWLARQTGTPERTVYAYSRGARPASERFLARAGEALGVEVTR